MIKDKSIIEIIKSIKQLKQRQYDLRTQLVYASKICNKLGLYDASDYIKTITKDRS